MLGFSYTQAFVNMQMCVHAYLVEGRQEMKVICQGKLTHERKCFPVIDLGLYCKQPCHLAKVPCGCGRSWGWRGVDRWTDAVSKTRVVVIREKVEAYMMLVE